MPKKEGNVGKEGARKCRFKFNYLIHSLSWSDVGWSPPVHERGWQPMVNKRIKTTYQNNNINNKNIKVRNMLYHCFPSLHII